MLLKKLTTNKLFYKKYPYKITCNIKGCWLVKSYGWENTKDYCRTGIFKYSRYKPNVDNVNLYHFIDLMKPFSNQVKFRFEHDFFDVYVEEKSLYTKLQDILSQWMVSICEPENDTELLFLLEEKNAKKVVCKNLPHGKYRYKIHLRYKTDIDVRQNFAKWMLNYHDRIRAPQQTLHWLERDNHWHWTPFIYVEDLPTLTMVGLFLGRAVMRVEEYIPKVSINTTL